MKRAALGQVPTDSNWDETMPAEARAKSIQAEVERPILRDVSLGVGALGVLSGGAQIYFALDYDPGLRGTGIAAGGAEAGGGVAYAIGGRYGIGILQEAGSAFMEGGMVVGTLTAGTQSVVDLTVGMGMFAQKLYEPIHEEIDRINSFGQEPHYDDVDRSNVWYIDDPDHPPTPFERWQRGDPLDTIPPPSEW
jgi:hypothetical protein